MKHSVAVVNSGGHDKMYQSLGNKTITIEPPL
jgi:hypothetical protein